MAEINYLDFDLSIEPLGEGSYRARVLDSPGGQASGDFKLPFSDLELENFVLRVGRTRRGTRRLESPEMEQAKNFGGNLFRAVFSNDVYSCLRSSLEKVEEQGRGLRLRLRLNDAPELVDLPWEYLYNPGLNRFLSLSIDTPLVRYLELPERISPLAVELPLKILVMIASPQDYPPLDVEKEWQNLQSALGDLERKGAVILERLSSATPVALQYRMRRKDFHIFHFVGHGAFDEGAQDGVLVMEDEQKRGRLLSGQYLGALLHDEKTLRMSVLNACEGARSGKKDPFAGAAQSLVQQGIPAVVAMQFEVLDQAAISFAREFYAALADGYPVDASLNEARKVMFSTGLDTEWGAPVLYMRSPDGQIFDIKQILGLRTTQTGELPALDPQLEQKLEKLYLDGLSAYWLKDWRKAITNFDAYLARKPGAQDVVAKLEEAKRQVAWLELDEQAQEASQEKDWPRAVAVLEKLVEQAPSYENAAERLEEARKQARLEELYEQAKQLYDAKQWQAVVNIFDQIATIEPDYPDEGGILAAARKEIRAQEREAQLSQFYRQALEAMDKQQWEEAKRLLKQVQGIDPGYRDSEPLLKVVEESLARINTEEVDARPAKKVAKPPAESESRKVEEQNAQTDEQEQSLDEKYRKALQAIDQKDWAQAEANLLEISAVDPNYGNVQDLLEGNVQHLLEQARSSRAMEAGQKAISRPAGELVKAWAKIYAEPLLKLLRENWGFVLKTGLIWGGAFLVIHVPILVYFDVSDPDLFYLTGGAAGGYFLWRWYRQAGLDLSRFQMALMIIVWGLAALLSLKMLEDADSIESLTFVMMTMGITGGLGTWLVIAALRQKIQWSQVLKHGLIWMSSWLAGMIWYALLVDNPLSHHDKLEGSILAFSAGALSGALGGLLSLQQIRRMGIAPPETAPKIESEAAPVQTISAGRSWLSTIMLALISGLAYFVIFLGFYSESISGAYGFIVGGLVGFFMWLILRKKVLARGLEQLVLLAIGWGLGGTSATISLLSGESNALINGGILGLVGGLSTGIAIAMEKRANRLGLTVILTAIWILGWVAGFKFFDSLIYNLPDGGLISGSLLALIAGLLAGAIGGAGTLLAVRQKVVPAKAP